MHVYGLWPYSALSCLHSYAIGSSSYRKQPQQRRRQQQQCGFDQTKGANQLSASNPIHDLNPTVKTKCSGTSTFATIRPSPVARPDISLAYYEKVVVPMLVTTGGHPGHTKRSVMWKDLITSNHAYRKPCVNPAPNFFSIWFSIIGEISPQTLDPK